jgi:hypothetical protein
MLEPKFSLVFQGRENTQRVRPENEFILTLAAAAAATAGQSRLPHERIISVWVNRIVGNSSHTPSITLTALSCP